MSRLMGMMLAVAALAALSAGAIAQTATDMKPAVAAADVTTITAKVEAIDAANRTVTVRGPLGRSVTIKAGEQVKNFAQLKVGDDLVLKYAEAVSVALKKTPGGRSETTTTTGPVTAAPGAKPGVAMAQQTVWVANVEQVDAKRNVVLLQGPQGRYAEVKVKDPKVMSEVKAGDQVEITYTEAVLLEAVAPKK